LRSINATLNRTLNHPTASLDSSTRQLPEQPLIEARQDIGCNPQYNLPLQCDPKPAAIALQLAHTPFEQGKTGAPDLLRFQYRRAPPQPQPRSTRMVLGSLLATHQGDVW